MNATTISKKTSYSWSAGIAIIVFLGLLILFLFTVNIYRDGLIERAHNDTDEELNIITHNLANTVNRRLGLLDGVWAFALAHLDDEEHIGEEFDAFASSLYRDIEGIFNLALAPDGVLRIVYPLAGNESIIGHDLVNDEREQVRIDVQQAIETKEIVLSGPYNLTQGGFGLVGRKAVFNDGVFWGLATMVVDMNPILTESGLVEYDDHLKIALQNDVEQTFWGDEAVFAEKPSLHIIPLPDGYWTIGAIPKDGWDAAIARDLREFEILGFVAISVLTLIVYGGINRQIQLTNRAKESEARYLDLYHNAPDMYFTVDAKTRRIMQCNQTFIDAIGYSREELIGQPIYKFYDASSVELANDTYQRYLQTGRVENVELTYKRKNGTTFIASLHATSTRDDAGTIKHGHSILRDVTNQQKISNTLRFIAQRRWKHDRQGFFEDLVTYLAEALGVTYAFVGELTPNDSVQTIALYAHGAIGDNMEYDLADTPCNNVVDQSICTYTHDVHTLFPKDVLLTEMGARSYSGVPLWDSAGEPLGIIVIIDTKPITDVEQIEAIVQIMADRVAHELEQHRVDKILRESEERFRRVFEVGPIGIYLIDNQGKFSTVNDRFCEMIGWQAHDLIGRLTTDVVHPDDHFIDKISATLSENKTFSHERRYLHKDGSIVWTFLKTTVVRNEDGKILYSISMVENINERKKAENTLQLYNDFQELVISLAAKFIDLPTDHIDAELQNALAAIGQFTGAIRLHLHEFVAESFVVRSSYRWQNKDYEPVTTIKVKFLHWLAKQLKQQEFVTIANVGELPTDEEIELETLKEQGTGALVSVGHLEDNWLIGLMTLHFEISVPHESIVGLIRIVGDVFFNVLKRKQTSEEIARLNRNLQQRVIESTTELGEERLRTETILQSIADAVVFTDRDSNILYVNPAWERLTGYSLAEAQGAKGNLLSSEQTEKSVFDDMWKAILNGKVWTGIVLNKRKDGTLYDAELTIAPVLDEKDSSVQYFVGVQRDVTESRKLARMKERFIADAAHDLGNPVTTLQTSLYLLKKDPSQLERRLAQIERETNRLTALVRDLLTVSRLDRGTMEPEFERFNMVSMVHDIVESQIELAKQKGVQIRFKNGDRLPYIMGDPRQIERVVVNLVTNALNYTERDGEINIDLHSDGAEVVLAVQDSGIGIDPKHLPHIFERFYRSDRARQTAEGTGLGLSIVKEIINLHDGHISVASSEGEGTTFTVRLPML